MKKLLLIIFLIGIYSCNTNKPSGIWMSSNNRLKDSVNWYETGTTGFVIDFDNKTWSHMFSNSSIRKFNIDYSNRLLQFENDSLKIEYIKYNNDSIEIELFDNIISVFRPINLSFKIEKSKQEIFDLLVSTKFENIKDSTNLNFKRDFHRFDKTKELRQLSGEMFGGEIYGYWFLGECQNNYFLIFAIDDSEPTNIYQIKSMKDNLIELITIEETDMIYGLNELKPVYNNAHKKLLN